jgi:hypothetical protein
VRLFVNPHGVIYGPSAVDAQMEMAGDSTGWRIGLGIQRVENCVNPPPLPCSGGLEDGESVTDSLIALPCYYFVLNRHIPFDDSQRPSRQ